MNSIIVFGEHEPNTLAQLDDVASRAERAALMADGHLGYVMPIGGVAAYRDQVSVVGVGFDIACGNAAIRTDLSLHGTPGSPTGSTRSPTRSRTWSRSASAARTARTMRRWIIRCSRAPSWDAVPQHARRGTAQQGARAARHRRQRQSLRRRLRRRSGRDLGRRPLRQPRLRSHGRVGFLALSQGAEVGHARARARGAAPARSADGAGLLGAHDARGRVRLRRPRVGRAQGRVDPRRPRAGARAQPSQLRVARGARRRDADRGAQGRDAGVSRARRDSSAARWATTR